MLLPQTQMGLWETHEVPLEAHFRGLHVVTDDIVWISGTKGSWMMTKDGGKKWRSGVIPGAEKLDFRDIHGFSEKVALAMSSTQGDGRIYRTTNGGKDWQLVFKMGGDVFLDGMDFTGDIGVAYGDPIRQDDQGTGKWLILRSEDQGQTWREIRPKPAIKFQFEEAGFASSGTGIVVRGNKMWIGSGGGATSRVFYSPDLGETWEIFNTPMATGESAGIFSMVFYDDNRAVAVGGKFTSPLTREGTCAVSTDGGRTWQKSDKTPDGYRSCVATDQDSRLTVAVGRSGTDFSIDGGKTWKPFAKVRFNAVGIGLRRCWAVGPNGAVASFDTEKLYP